MSMLHYIHMANARIQLWYHLVWCTRNRVPWITPALEKRLCGYIRGIARKHGMQIDCISAMPDHIHLLVRIPQSLSLADALRHLKRGSSFWVQSLKETSLYGYHWHDGCGAFSVSPNRLDAVRRYISHQEAHHRAEDFDEEMQRLVASY